MSMQIVTVFGGSGFIGRHLVARLAKSGLQIRVAVRKPSAALFLKPMGDVGQISLVQANLRHSASVEAALEGVDAVVNLVGILYEKGHQRFLPVHRDAAANLAKLSAQAGASSFVHVSALGASTQSQSRYSRSKALGEEAIRKMFPNVTILRPSVVFGPYDDFFNRFAKLATFLPVLPVFGCPFPRLVNGQLDIFVDGGTKFQPVYAGDVAAAVVKCLTDQRTQGQVYELGGPVIYSFKDLMEIILRETGRRRLLFPEPFWLANIQAYFLELLPHPPLTRDQVALLKYDNVVRDSTHTLETLGIKPTVVDAVLPTYLNRFRGSDVSSRFH